MGNDEAKVIETNNKATLFYSGGEKYEGEILEGKRHGFGTYFYQTGDRYTGMWEQNMKHGRGTMFYANEEVYEGWWNNNLREGVGTLFYQNGERYYGEWKNNKKCGQGFIHATDGSKYIGQFKNNKKDGVGEIIGIGKEKITEEWRDGKLHKRHDKTKSIKEEKDYVKLDTDQLQRYLDSKMIQSEKNKKYISLEIAKVIRSKNIDVNLENRKALNNEFLTNNPDLTSWTVQEVVEWFKNFELEKYESVIKQENIDGSKLNLMELNNLLKILKPEEKKDFNNITFSFEILKKIKKEDPLKSIRSFK